MDDSDAHARFTLLLLHHQPDILRSVRLLVPHAADDRAGGLQLVELAAHQDGDHEHRTDC